MMTEETNNPQPSSGPPSAPSSAPTQEPNKVPPKQATPSEIENAVEQGGVLIESADPTK